MHEAHDGAGDALLGVGAVASHVLDAVGVHVVPHAVAQRGGLDHHDERLLDDLIRIAHAVVIAVLPQVQQQADLVVVRVVVGDVRREAVVLQGQIHQRLDARRVGPWQQGGHPVLVAEQGPQRGLYFVGRVGARTDREVLVQQPVGFIEVTRKLD